MGFEAKKNGNKTLRRLNKSLLVRFKTAQQSQSHIQTAITETQLVAKAAQEAQQQAEERLRAVHLAIQSLQDGLEDAENQISKLTSGDSLS